jgi:hypothetical protein
MSISIMNEPWKKGPPQPPTLKQQVIKSVKRFVAQKQREGVMYINIKDVEYTIDNVTYVVGRMARDVGFMHLDRIIFNYLKTNFPYESNGSEDATKHFKIL